MLHFAQGSRTNFIFCSMAERTTPAEEKYYLGIVALQGK